MGIQTSGEFDFIWCTVKDDLKMSYNIYKTVI